MIYTFYSYKGGAGRSMALANVAALMSKWGKKVLIVDCDLEAPGIERFFEAVQPNVTKMRGSIPGMVDLIASFAEGGTPEWRRCIIQAQPFSAGEPISIITAGQNTPTYVDKVQRLRWDYLFEERGLGDFLELLRNDWQQEFDCVLIDSRTGISDIGGICTVLFPDVLVTLFTTNRQSITGVGDVMRRAMVAQGKLPLDRPRLLAVPVLGREEQSEYILTNQWKARIASELGDLYKNWIQAGMVPNDILRRLYIPYVPYWSFGERLPVSEREEELADPRSISAAYSRLAKLLVSGLSWASIDIEPETPTRHRDEQESPEPLETALSNLSDKTLSIATLGVVVLTIAALAAFGLLCVTYWQKSRQFQHLLTSTVLSKSEIVGRSYTGLEAYLLANLNKESKPPGPDVPPKVSTVIGELRRTPKIALPFDALKIVPADPFKQLAAHDQYVTNQDSRDAFMFVPGIVVPRKASTDDGLTEINLFNLLDSQEQLAIDIRTIYHNQAALRELDDITVDSHHVVQSYLLTETGVLALRENDLNPFKGDGQLSKNTQGRFYQNRFLPYQFFPERGHFWRSIVAARRSEPTAGFSYISEIYLDLGGNGFVRTYCKTLTKINEPGLVLCVDIGLNDESMPILKKNMQVFGTTLERVTCVLPTAPICQFDSSDHSAEATLSALRDALAAAGRNAVSSNVVGQITIYPSLAQPNVVSFTIPVSLGFTVSGDQWRVSFLVGSIDVPKLQRNTDLLALEAFIVLACLFLCVAWLVWYYLLRITQQRQVLDGVARVMEEAETPFAWTDERNQFVSANGSFINLLGFENLMDLQRKPGGAPRTFFELLAPNRREHYLTLLKERRPSNQPYVTEVMTKSGSRLRVVVRSDSIPFPGVFRRSLPHRFGVFLRWNETSS